MKKKIYFNQMLYERFKSFILGSPEEEAIKQNDNFTDTLEKISYDEIIESFFENGLNINHFYVDFDTFNGIPITMIEDLTMTASNSMTLLKIYEQISPEFFKSLKYSEQSSIVDKLVSKSFFAINQFHTNQFALSEIEYLLNVLYEKGFRVNQQKEHSIEVDWILNGYADPVRVMILNQKDFNFDFKYLHNGKEMDYTSIIEHQIIYENNNKEPGYEGKIIALEQILETCNQLIIYQTISETMQQHPTAEDESDNFKI